MYTLMLPAEEIDGVANVNSQFHIASTILDPCTASVCGVVPDNNEEVVMSVYIFWVRQSLFISLSSLLEVGDTSSPSR